jgi:outer membrane protein OmpA-like peptidoglycan-associated protein
MAVHCFKPEDGPCVDLCVLEPEDPDGYQDDDGCPEPDNDADSILDGKDKCPNDPEDPDGFEDDDGCPDEDNDEDKIVDVKDKCPLVKGVPEEDGCPAKIEGVVITEKKIEILEKIYFEFNKAAIMPESFGILDKVVQVLKAYPEIKIEVQGHTDSKGKDDYNFCLSDARAESVMNYLIAHGIESYRLSSVGYGETCFIDTNATPDGRANNRRVEFIRTDVDEIERACPIPEVPSKTEKKCKALNKKFKIYKAY